MVSIHGAPWPSGLVHRICVLMTESSECGFESWLWPWCLCPSARHFTTIAALHPGVNGYLWGQSLLLCLIFSIRITHGLPLGFFASFNYLKQIVTVFTVLRKSPSKSLFKKNQYFRLCLIILSLNYTEVLVSLTTRFWMMTNYLHNLFVISWKRKNKTALAARADRLCINVIRHFVKTLNVHVYRSHYSSLRENAKTHEHGHWHWYSNTSSKQCRFVT